MIVENKLNILWIFLIDGYKHDQFGSIYNGKYLIKVHSRTNALGNPIDMKNLDFITKSYHNVPVFIDDNNNSFQNDKNIKINYNK